MGGARWNGQEGVRRLRASRRGGFLRRGIGIVSQELGGLRIRRSVLSNLVRVLPELTCNRLRTMLLRAAGLRIGDGTSIGGSLIAIGPATLSIGRDCWINTGSRFDLSADISIGDRVAVGQNVLILTNSHQIGDSWARAGLLANRSVHVGDGCWLGARAVILPGVTVGAGAIVAAGAVVTRDVEPDTLVGGVPATKIRDLRAIIGEGRHRQVEPLDIQRPA